MNNKMWATGLSAVFATTILLSGVAKAGENDNTSTPAAPSEPPTTEAPKVDTKAEAKAALTDEIAAAKKLKEDNKDVKVAAIAGLDKALSEVENTLDSGKSTETDYKAAINNLKSSEAAVNNEAAEREKNLKALPDALEEAKAVSTDKKPTKDVEKLTAAIAAAEKIIKSPNGYSAADIKSAEDKLDSSKKVVKAASTVLKVSTGTDGKLTVKFQTQEGKTVFPNGANKVTSSGTAKAKDGDDYIELKTLNDLVDNYGLVIPKGFELADGSTVPTTAENVTTVTLKQADKATFNQAYVTFKFTLNGKVVEAAGDSATFSSLQLTDDTINAADVISEYKDKDAVDYADFKKYFYKSGYTVDKNDKTFTFSNNSYHQTKTINFVKKPSSLKVVAKPYTVSYMSDVPSNQFKAGVKYSSSLISKLKIFANANSNELLDNKKYDIKILSVIKNSDPKSKPTNYVKDGSVVFPTANVNYRVKVSIAPKSGYGFTKTSAAAKTFTTLAYAKDSEPVISGVKNATYSKSFSYTKGITAFDYVDNKNVKVTYKGKVNTAKKGSYKIYYYATDSKGNTAKKTRTVTVK